MTRPGRSNAGGPGSGQVNETREGFPPPELAASIAQFRQRIRPARLGSTMLVLIDGPSGAGKTTFAGELAAQMRAQCVHTDDLLNGWDDQFTYWNRLEELVFRPLRNDEPGRYQAYDWHQERFAGDWHVVKPGRVLIVEGVGAAREVARGWSSLIVYVDAPLSVREARSLARDGEAMQAQLKTWREREELHFGADATAWCADVVIEAYDGWDTDSGSTPRTGLQMGWVNKL